MKALLSHLFTVALREWGGGLPANPVLLVRKPKGNARDRRLQGEETVLRLSLSEKERGVLSHGHPEGFGERLLVEGGMQRV